VGKIHRWQLREDGESLFAGSTKCSNVPWAQVQTEEGYVTEEEDIMQTTQSLFQGDQEGALQTEGPQVEVSLSRIPSCPKLI
jgi:hypothetical protein